MTQAQKPDDLQNLNQAMLLFRVLINTVLPRAAANLVALRDKLHK